VIRTSRITHRATSRALAVMLTGAAGPSLRAGDFADAVVAYNPAPGQRVNTTGFNNPASALGAPLGGGTFTPPDTQKIVTLGGFGGSIVLRFADPVLDDPCNPFGLDAVVFGNAYWVGSNPNRRFAEAGVIEISLDANANGLADDAWFLIPGSHIPVSPPPDSARESQQWDNNAGTSTPPSNIAWYPAGLPGVFTTSTFALPALFDVQVLQNPLGLAATREGIFGYTDCSPTLLLGDTNADNTIDAPAITAGEFYTAPDNPLAVGVTPGSGGGDAFDIAWAVDPATGQPANLPAFHFIRISVGVNFVAGALGEVSTELSAVSDVRPRESFYDLTGDARADADDLYRWHELRAASSAPADLDGDASITDRDRAMMQRCVRRAEPDTGAPEGLPPEESN
jgi:hypothetical protein